MPSGDGSERRAFFIMNNIWKYIKADTFFKDYLPHIKSHKFKIRGLNSRGNPIDFSKDEKKQIKKAAYKMLGRQ
jgi:hypothetical protein